MESVEGEEVEQVEDTTGLDGEKADQHATAEGGTGEEVRELED